MAEGSALIIEQNSGLKYLVKKMEKNWVSKQKIINLSAVEAYQNSVR